MKCTACNDEQSDDAKHCGSCGTTFGKPIIKKRELVIKVKLERNQLGELMCPFCESTYFEVNIDYIKCECEKQIPIKIEVVE